MKSRPAFSLVELLVVLAIVAVAASLLLPAIQRVREASRIAACQNNLKQIAAAALLHHDSQGTFPYGGWGYRWIGVPDRGFGPRQPGGWVYNLLPMVEQSNLRRLGASELPEDYSQRVESPLCLLNCPSRRACRPWPISPLYPYASRPRPHGSPRLAGRSDYAINAGATMVITFAGPTDLAEGESADFMWPTMQSFLGDPFRYYSGISHVRRAASLRQLEDGASNTYLFGDKFVNPAHYDDGEAPGDRLSLQNGYSTDNYRFARGNLSPIRDATRPPDAYAHARFGSAHAGALNFAFCDGSVSGVSYDVAPQIHFHCGHISDHGIAESE
ncbi:MAG: DUF1559 domain-containing protein [Planctomycetota bacterium]